MNNTKKDLIINNKFRILSFSIFLSIYFFSCDRNGGNDYLSFALSSSGANQSELKKVLRNFQNDPEKLEQAQFLIMNMPGHFSYQGELLNEYKKIIFKNEQDIDITELNKIWKEHLKLNFFSIELKSDIEIINSDYLINMIKDASDFGKITPWYNQIDETVYLQYILPYRIYNESISDYREILRDAYSPLITNIKDPKEAFTVVYNHILKNFKVKTPEYPYIPDVLTLHKLKSGTCAHRCIYMVAVMRSLSIPASYEYVSNWANYSQGGHSWVAYIDNNQDPYTIAENTLILRRNNKIDASVLTGADVIEDLGLWSLNIDSVKKISKVFRYSFPVLWENKTLWSDNNTPLLFKNAHVQDVSDKYNFQGRLEFDNIKNIDYAYLYTFAAIRNWQPAAYAKIDKNKVIFDHLGTGIVYLPVIHKKEQFTPIGFPVILYDDGRIHSLNPDESNLRTVILKRKYPFFSQWVRRNSRMIGGKFEGADTPDFRNPALLYQITDLPFGVTEKIISVPDRFRYVRYLPPEKTRTSIAETSYYTFDDSGNEKLLQGKPIGFRIESEYIKNAFDGDYSTYTETKFENYWFGLDLGEARKINKIKYCPKNDGNIIEKGKDYELFYFSDKWNSLGKVVAETDSLIFNDVPENSLLWLKCHSGGREERIFTYENGKQIWW